MNTSKYDRETRKSGKRALRHPIVARTLERARNERRSLEALLAGRNKVLAEIQKMIDDGRIPNMSSLTHLGFSLPEKKS